MKKFLLSLFCSLIAFASIQAEGAWTLVTDASTLKADDQIVIVASAYDFALSTEQKENNRGQASVTKNDNTITFNNGVQIITLKVGITDGTFAFYTGAGYLYAANSKNNYLKTKTDLDANGSWKVEITAEGVATIKAQGANTRNWLRYNSTSTLFSCYASGQKDVSIYKYTVNDSGETPSVPEALATPKITPGSCSFNDGESLEVTISAAEGARVYYTTNGDDPTENSTLYKAPFTVNETTTVKAIAVKEGYKNSAKAEATYTMIVSIEGSVADAIAEYDENQRKNATITGYIVGTAYRTIKNPSFTIPTEIASNILIADNADETDETKCIAVELQNNKIRAALNLVNNPYNHKKKITLTGSLEKYLQTHGLKEVNSYDFVIEGDWATMYHTYDRAVPAGYEAYIVTGVDNGYAKLKQITGIIPAEKGVILKRNENAVNDNSVKADVTGNLLEGSIASDTITAKAYVLGYHNGEIGLYKAKTEGFAEGTFVNNAGKAYLPASALGSASNIQFYGFRFDDEEGTTAIENVEVVTEEVIFDLSGRRVSEITEKGIYIVNGKKVLVK